MDSICKKKKKLKEIFHKLIFRISGILTNISMKNVYINDIVGVVLIIIKCIFQNVLRIIEF
jgi:hypothetical protein